MEATRTKRWIGIAQKAIEDYEAGRISGKRFRAKLTNIDRPERESNHTPKH